MEKTKEYERKRRMDETLRQAQGDDEGLALAIAADSPEHSEDLQRKARPAGERPETKTMNRDMFIENLKSLICPNYFS